MFSMLFAEQFVIGNMIMGMAMGMALITDGTIMMNTIMIMDMDITVIMSGTETIRWRGNEAEIGRVDIVVEGMVTDSNNVIRSEENAGVACWHVRQF